MVGYLKAHEAKVRAALETTGEGFDWVALARYHRRRLGDLQHERQVHLLVMLFVGLYALIAFLAFWARPERGMGALVVLFLVLLVPYVAHYFRLENGVQRLYLLADEIDRRRAEIPGDEMRQ